MIIKIDIRETSLLHLILNLISTVSYFKSLKVKTETLPIGDIIINDEKEDRLIIERKSVDDLLASIKDGRYEEQSYRLNGLNHHNHNIIYLIEGDVNYTKKYNSNNEEIKKLTLYSAMFSLNYYKGFSVFRSFSLNETSNIICNMAYKLSKDTDKQPFYKSNITFNNINNLNNMNNTNKLTELNDDNINSINNNNNNNTSVDINTSIDINKPDNLQENDNITDKDYVSVIKKIKKDNITIENIGEIMLCQIPGISSVTALAIMNKYKTLPNLIKELELNNNDMNNLTYLNSKGQTRKISKTCISNIVKYLLKK